MSSICSFSLSLVSAVVPPLRFKSLSPYSPVLLPRILSFLFLLTSSFYHSSILALVSLSFLSDSLCLLFFLSLLSAAVLSFRYVHSLCLSFPLSILLFVSSILSVLAIHFRSLPLLPRILSVYFALAFSLSFLHSLCLLFPLSF